MQGTLRGAAAAAFAALALTHIVSHHLAGQATVGGAQPQGTGVAVSKGAGFANSRAAIINSSGYLDGIADAVPTDCVYVNATSGPCGVGTVNKGAGWALSRAAVINSSGLIDGAAGTAAWCLQVNGASTGVCLIAGPGFAVSRAAVINSSGTVDGAAGTPSDCLHVDGSSGACPGGGSAPNFADDEVPSQVDALDYTLVHTPSPAASLNVSLNGLHMERGVDYTLSGNTVTFGSYYSALLADPLVSGTVLVASYRY